MTDRFKFRAWELPDNKLDFMGNLHYIKPYQNNSFFDYCIERPKEYILMQSTSLKDKNDKLIYEGDIVKDCEGIYEIRWGRFMTGFNAYYSEKGYTSIQVSSAYSEEYKHEIIGNIYENPELLNNLYYENKK